VADKVKELGLSKAKVEDLSKQLKAANEELDYYRPKADELVAL
jgi:hypothetical protein